MTTSTAVLRLDYVHDHDRIRAELLGAQRQLGKLCGRIASVGCELIPTPQEPGDANDQLYGELDEVVQQVAKLADLAGLLGQSIR